MKIYIATLAFFFGLLVVNIYSLLQRPYVDEAAKTVFEVTNKVDFQIEYGSTIFDTLRELDVSAVEIQKIIQASKAKYNLARIPADTDGTAFFTKGPFKTLNQLEISLSPIRKLHIIWSPENGWHASIKSMPVTTKLMTYEGKVSISLWDSAQAAGVNPLIISKLADIFAWQIDFSREVQSGDSWKIVVEEHLVNDIFYGYGKILVAEYAKNGQRFKAIRFPATAEKADYYSPDGQSLRRMFLRSPLRYARISSRFRRQRFHPVLKINRPHYGVDYAAAPGTPVKAVGDGVIEYAKWRGGAGRTVKIRHNHTYATAYCHLRSYARGMKRGKKIRQGQVIGYVGSSGLATGPHLHFEFYQNNRYIDPLGRHFPSANPISDAKKAEFQEAAKVALKLLEKTNATIAKSEDGENKLN